MDIEIFKKGKIIQEDIAEIKKKIQRIKDSIPQIVSGDKLILTYGELQEMGIVDAVIEALKDKIIDLENRFKNL